MRKKETQIHSHWISWRSASTWRPFLSVCSWCWWVQGLCDVIQDTAISHYASSCSSAHIPQIVFMLQKPSVSHCIKSGEIW